MAAPQINIEQVIQHWAEVAVDRFHESLDTYEVGKLDGELWKSIAYELSRNGNDIEKVILKFKQYGRFVDMGVGRGVPVGARGTQAFAQARENNGRLRHYGRRPKPWYSKAKTREVSILREILVRDYGINTLGELESAFEHTEIVNI